MNYDVLKILRLKWKCQLEEAWIDVPTEAKAKDYPSLQKLLALPWFHLTFKQLPGSSLKPPSVSRPMGIPLMMDEIENLVKG